MSETCVDSKSWQKVQVLAEIRNSIIHSNGVVEKSSHDRKSLYYKMIKEKMIKENKIEKSLVQCEPCILEKDKVEIMLTYAFVTESVSEFRKVAMEICNYPLYADVSM